MSSWIKLLLAVLFLLSLSYYSSGCYFAYLESKYEYYRTSCGLTEVPPDIPSEAKMVQLVDNNISNINVGTFEHLFYCAHLSLNENDLVHLRSGMFTGMQHLKELWLDSNSISDIEAKTFINLTFCTELHLADNKLTQIRLGMFDGLQSLKELWLDKNSISDIEVRSFINLTECTELVLHTNRLTYLRVGMFDGLKFLKELWLHENNISAIEVNSFVHLAECTKLSLHHNRLSHLQTGMFNGLESLKYLELSYNSISSVEAAIFTYLTQMVELNLYDNLLKTLERDSFATPLQTNLALRIRRNPLHCDSKMCWIKQAERERRIRLSGKLHWGRSFFKPDCENYQGVTWDGITLDCFANEPYTQSTMPAPTARTLSTPTINCSDPTMFYDDVSEVTDDRAKTTPENDVAVIEVPGNLTQTPTSETGLVVGLGLAIGVLGPMIIVTCACLILRKCCGWRSHGTPQKGAATEPAATVAEGEIELNPAYGHGRQEVQEQLIGFPGIMIRDLRNIPREQLRQEESERRKAIREVIRTKRRKPPVTSSTISIQRSKQVRECKKDEPHRLMTIVTGEVSSNVTTEESEKKSSRIKRIRNALGKGTSTLEAETSKDHTECNPAYWHGRQEVEELLLNFPGIMHRDFRNIPGKQSEQEECERFRMIREAIGAVRKKKGKTEICHPSPEPGSGGIFESVERETRDAECGAVRVCPASEVQNQTNPFLVCVEREIVDEEVYDEIIESEMMKDIDLIKN